MNERIKELAEQAGLVSTWEGWVSTHKKHAEGVLDEFLERFAELVAADEREACLAIVETHPTVRAMSIAIKLRGEK